MPQTCKHCANYMARTNIRIPKHGTLITTWECGYCGYQKEITTTWDKEKAEPKTKITNERPPDISGHEKRKLRRMLFR